MRRPATMNVDAMTRKVEVDNRIPLRNYYRIANNLLRQANIHRGEKNIIDLYIILLRYSSLVTETIPYHRDYQALHPKERALSKKMLLAVLDELEGLKPEFQRQFHGIGKETQVTTQPYQLNNQENHHYRPVGNSLGRPYTNNDTSSDYDYQWAITNAPSSTWKQNNEYSRISSPTSIDMQFQKLSLNFSVPKQETLSRHSFLGPNGLRGQWSGPSSEIKVNYPANDYQASNEILSLNQVEDGSLVSNNTSLKVDKSTMESVLSLDDGRWLHPTEDSNFQFPEDVRSDIIPLSNLRQPSPPPVLAQLQQEFRPISPSKVADPRPGPAKSIQDGPSSSNSYQHLHVPVRLMEDFLRLARENTAKNLETCGVLAGSLENRVFHITTLIVPKQESTSDSCQTLNEEEIFEIQDKQSLFPLGWIHVTICFGNTSDFIFKDRRVYMNLFVTHPSQTCFMSSVDLHTHYSYQIMLPEAIAIVMAPTDTASPHGIFHLSDPSGVSVIRNCQQRGFHPHEEPDDGSPIYEHCSHVYMNANMKFDIVDLR